MPAVSKAQQRFMGIVRSIQKGNAEASDYSKEIRSAAKSMKKKDVKDFADTDRKGLPEERDYKDEYKKFQSSDKSKKYRAELNKYNRKKGTYGNGDGKDASHKGGKIAGFEKESTNRGRREKSRLKKEEILKLRQMIREELQNSQGEQTDFKKGDLVKDINPDCPHVGSEGGVIKVGKGTITFKVTNNGKTYHAGDELEKTVDQMVKLSQSPFADDHEETEKQPMSEAIKVRVGETAKTGKWVVYNPETNVSIKEVGNTRAATRLMNRLMSSGQYDNVASRWVGEIVKEKISKEEWSEYPKYARKLKPYMRRLLKIPVKVRVIKQANHNPWIDVRVARSGKDIIPNDFRKRALKVIGGGRARDMDNINYGNIRTGSVSLKYDEWVKLLGNKVK